MSLSSFKDTENLESEIEQLSDDINKLYFADKTRLMDEIIQEYKDYLTKEGFTLKHQDRNIIANYGSATIALEVPPYEENYFGAIHVLKLVSSQKGKESWNIAIHRGKSMSFGVTSVEMTDKNKDKNLILIEKRDQIKAKIDNYKPIVYGLNFYKEGSKDKGNSPSVSTITEVITAIFD